MNAISRTFQAFLYRVFLGFVAFAPAQGHAQSYVVTIKEKQEDKYKNRWTLADWFETQRKVRLQDMWLAGVSNRSPFEFLLGYRASYMERDFDESIYRMNQAKIAAYAHMVGLEGHYIENDSDGDGWNALFNFRLIGDAAQNTNVTLSYGLRHRESHGEDFRNQFYQASLTLYLMKSFGVKTLYRGFLEAESSRDRRLTGNDLEAEAFIDFSLIRIHGGMLWQRRKLRSIDGSTMSDFKGSGFVAGATLFL